MPKCSCCGKWGFFLHVGSTGLCEECVQRKEIEHAEELKALRIKEQDEKRAAAFRRAENARNEVVREFREKVFPLHADVKAVPPFFDRWAMSDHDREDQIVRQIRAITKTVPVFICREQQFAFFVSQDEKQGTREIYKTSLCECACKDFQERKMPCKHMYRLLRALTDESHVDQKLVLASTRVADSFGTLHDKTKIEFAVQCMSQDFFGDGLIVYDSWKIKEEIEAGIVTEFKEMNYVPLFERIAKNDILFALSKNSVEGFKSSWSKYNLAEWANNTQREFCASYFGYPKLVIASGKALEWGKAIYKEWKQCTHSMSLEWEYKSKFDKATEMAQKW